MGFRSIGGGCGCCGSGGDPSPPIIETSAEIEPKDWMKIGNAALKNAVKNFGETDVWIIRAPDCDTITVAKRIRLALDTTNALLDTSLSTEIVDCLRRFKIRPDEWKRFPELGECPRKGWFIYVEESNETIEIGAGEGFPVFDSTDGYGSFWHVTGKAVKPHFEFNPETFEE